MLPCHSIHLELQDSERNCLLCLALAMLAGAHRESAVRLVIELQCCRLSTSFNLQFSMPQAPNIRRALDGELYFYGKTLGFPVDMPLGLEPPEIVNAAA